MLKRGFLFKNTLYVSIAHSNNLINKYFEALDSSFKMLKYNLTSMKKNLKILRKIENIRKKIIQIDGYLEDCLKICSQNKL